MTAGLLDRARDRLYEPRPPRRRAPGILEMSFSAVGLVVGLWFFSISLTPSLLPREGWVQGIESGVTFMVGYGIGASLFAVARFLTVPPPAAVFARSC
ncbi:hypothetical protein GCM10025876_30960 [Demequina litorisediminis]|uniref:Alpha/beta-hydrolase N-terminal domain-containing protein n=1 Tax=Demequina litorisediminis TaxID=1849022 RepID=A0ABQ6IJI7_9MICO|nr:hypothetical protein GCM10025876_30960 [Demequina litorisediminis]